MAFVNTAGLDNAVVLAALYAGARTGRFATEADPATITVEQARAELDRHPEVDYLHKRAIKVRLFGDDGFEAAFYDRVNGEGAAQRIVDALRTA